MFSLEALIMVAVILFCVGGLLGAIISRTLLAPKGQRDLEDQLRAARQELLQYRQDVTQHFMETSQRVNQLTQSYRDVHEHLAQGALQLTDPETGRKMLEAGEGLGKSETEQQALPEAVFEPPRDWAPKTPGQAGTLSEEFGLNDAPDDYGVETKTGSHKKVEA